MINTLSIKDLENISGIKAHTIRTWEKRYSIFDPKRTPTNIEIQRQVSAPARNHDISDTVSESAATSGKKGGKREVTSKIASLWKKIEDSKKKDKIDIIQKTKSKK